MNFPKQIDPNYYGANEYAEMPATAPASPVTSALGDIHASQGRTSDLIDNLFARLSVVLDHANKAGSAAGPQPVPPNASPLHGELMVIAERQGTQNQRLAELLNRITL